MIAAAPILSLTAPRRLDGIRTDISSLELKPRACVFFSCSVPSSHEVVVRYRELILLFHPDKMGSEGEQFASAINQAKELVWLATLIFWWSVHEQYLLISVRRRCGTLILGLQVLSSLQGGGLLGLLRERSALQLAGPKSSWRGQSAERQCKAWRRSSPFVTVGSANKSQQRSR